MEIARVLERARPLTEQELHDVDIATNAGGNVSPDTARRLVTEVKELRCSLHDARADALYGASGSEGCPMFKEATDCPHCSGRCGQDHG